MQGPSPHYQSIRQLEISHSGGLCMQIIHMHTHTHTHTHAHIHTCVYMHYSVRLISLAAQKFISEVAMDALQHSKRRGPSLSNRKGGKVMSTTFSVWGVLY